MLPGDRGGPLGRLCLCCWWWKRRAGEQCMRRRSSSLVGSLGRGFHLLAGMWGRRGRRGGWARFWLRFCIDTNHIVSSFSAFMLWRAKLSQHSF